MYVLCCIKIIRFITQLYEAIISQFCWLQMGTAKASKYIGINRDHWHSRFTTKYKLQYGTIHCTFHTGIANEKYLKLVHPLVYRHAGTSTYTCKYTCRNGNGLCNWGTWLLWWTWFNLPFSNGLQQELNWSNLTNKQNTSVRSKENVILPAGPVGFKVRAYSQWAWDLAFALAWR